MSVLVGCGDELADFRRNELRPLEQRADEQKAQLSTTLRTARLGDRGDARALEQQSRGLEATFAELERLEPPGEFEETYARYVAANRKFLAELRTFIDALKEGNEQALRPASRRAQEAVGAAQRAILPLKE